MKLTQFYHQHQMHRMRGTRDFHLFELAIWLHTLAHSLIAIFVPILLLKIGYSIGDVIIYYLIYTIIDVPLNFPVGHLIRKIGARKVLILGTIACIAFFALLGVLPPHNWVFLSLLALLAALYDDLFWVSHIYLFIEANRGGLEGGESAGALDGIRRFASVVGPIMGAVLLLTGGKIALVAVSLIVFALSLIPLFRMKHVADIPKGRALSSREFFKDTRERRDYTSLAMFGIQNEVDATLWPIFIFVIFGTLGSVAAVPVIVSLTTALFSYYAGKITKHYGARMIAIGSILLATTWILRLTISDQIFYYVTAFLVGFFALLIHIPLDGSVVNRGMKIGSLSAAIYRNASSMSLRIPLYIILALVVHIFKFSFLASAVSLFILLAVNAFIAHNGKGNIHRQSLA